MNILKSKELFLLDMDGTIYHENELIPGALDFIRMLKRQNKDFVFLTNNSSKSVKCYLQKLQTLGIPADINNMFSSSQATIHYLSERRSDLIIYPLGTEAFKKELVENGFKVVDDYDVNVNLLLVGFDTELNYSKLEIASKLLFKGVEYIATNLDLRCPIENNMFIPDCGAICNLLECTSDRKPFYIGKPRAEMVHILSELKGVDLDKIAIIGDRLYTDIACGINSGITSIAVLTGETKKEHIKDTTFKPDYVFNSINDLYNLINK